MSVTVTLNEPRIHDKIKNKTQRAQAVLDTLVLKDSNYYIPKDTGNLEKSGILHTVIGSGLVTWQTPYASAQYYGCPNKSHQINPNAAMKWFEVAKARNLNKWIEEANK